MMILRSLHGDWTLLRGVDSDVLLASSIVEMPEWKRAFGRDYVDKEPAEVLGPLTSNGLLHQALLVLLYSKGVQIWRKMCHRAMAVNLIDGILDNMWRSAHET